MSNIQDAIEAATAQAVAKAAIFLANAAVIRAKYKNRMIERRDAGDTCTGDYKELKIAYKGAKRKYRSCLAAYIATKESSK